MTELLKFGHELPPDPTGNEVDSHGKMNINVHSEKLQEVLIGGPTEKQQKDQRNVPDPVGLGVG